MQEKQRARAHITIAELNSYLTDQTLFIIGNGFDLMHGVPSRYHDFRDSIGRRNVIRTTMESYIHKPDIWGEFENNLAYLDRAMMMGELDEWLDDFGVLDEDDEDFSAADFFAAMETATEPVPILLYELPKRFRRWIQTLQPAQTAKPLLGLLRKDARYINFNYTEFLETLYDIPQQRICYIHGDRRDKKHQLVLGHGQNEELVFEAWYQANKERPAYQPMLLGRKGNPYRNDNPVYLAYFLQDDTLGNWKSQMRYDAINHTIDLIEDYYARSAKKTADVIQRHRSMIESLSSIQQIVVIGHSLSSVDWPYFSEIMNHTGQVHWYFSWHAQEDIKQNQSFTDAMGIPDDDVTMVAL
jgi:hypothetical protein